MVGSPDSLRPPGWPGLAYCEPTPTKGTILAPPCSRVAALCAGRRSSRAGDRLRNGLATVGHAGRAGAGCTRDEPARHRSRGAGPCRGRGDREGERDPTLEWTRQDGRWSVLVAATAGGVPSVALEWPQVVTTPWLVPGVVVGSLLLLIGIAWWVLILVAGRRLARAAAAPVPQPAALT